MVDKVLDNTRTKKNLKKNKKIEAMATGKTLDEIVWRPRTLYFLLFFCTS